MKNFTKNWQFTPVALLTFSLFLLTPCFFLVFSFWQNYEKIQILEDQLVILRTRAQKKERQRKDEELILTQIKESNPSYVKDVLGSMTFLDTQKQKWRIFLSQMDPSYGAKGDLNFLVEGANKLSFEETSIHETPLFQESLLVQKEPICVNENDLKKILSQIEGVPISPYLPSQGRPQLLINSFKIQKKNMPGTKEKYYELELKLFKRERNS